jgi:hypothetical protein
VILSFVVLGRNLRKTIDREAVVWQAGLTGPYALCNIYGLFGEWTASALTMTTMYSKLAKKTSSPSPFKLALNNSSSRPPSRLPTSTTSRIRSVSSKGKENVAPFSKKR